MAGEPDVVAVGSITRAHGVHGEVTVLPLTQVAERFEPGSRLLAGPEHRLLTVSASRPHRGRRLVRFEEIPDRSQAEALRGLYLFVRTDEVPALPADEYWPHQLVGCAVATDVGRNLGRIREVIRGTANDVWVASADGEDDVLIPALKDVIRSVDLEQRRIVVAEVPGLTVPEEEGGPR